jgi:sensor histidine kinase YesM
LFDTKTNKAKKITKKDGLLNNQAMNMLEDNDHNVWIGSQMGFSIIDARTKRFRNISRQNGLPEAEISYFAAIKDEDGKFIIGCEKGILIFDPADFKPDTIAPLLQIEQLSFSNPRDKKKNLDSVVLLYGKKEVRLSYKNNKVSFYYTALSYQEAALNQYSVWLEEYEKNWVNMGALRVATYTNLAPGTYIFHVKAANSDGVWTKTDETITVIITLPWWRTWWAYLLYALVFILAIWAFIAYRTAGIKREKEVLENKVSDRTTELKAAQNRLEMQSLRSQLNPHFMFNSLNAIQELILMEENEKSHSYLARFSKLLRMLLENTEKLFIPLQRELDFLQLYLSLEQLRIPELEFSLTVDPAIDTEQTVIPNMILQPYIENAIWHGLSHKPTDKKLQIRITKTNGAIQYEIEDNGVGRKKSAELKSLFRKEHKSKGMELLSKRFKLLSKEFGAEIETHYEDVMNNGEVGGTLVTIKVPNNFSEEIKKITSS